MIAELELGFIAEMLWLISAKCRLIFFKIRIKTYKHPRTLFFLLSNIVPCMNNEYPIEMLKDNRVNIMAKLSSIDT